MKDRRATDRGQEAIKHLKDALGDDPVRRESAKDSLEHAMMLGAYGLHVAIRKDETP